MIHTRPKSMKPNMTGLNQTGLGVSLVLPSVERGAFERVFELAIMRQSLADASLPLLTARVGDPRTSRRVALNLFT